MFFLLGIGILYFNRSFFENDKEVKVRENISLAVGSKNNYRTTASFDKVSEDHSSTSALPSHFIDKDDELPELDIQKAILRSENNVVSLNDNKYIVVDDFSVVKSDDYDSSLGRKVKTIGARVIFFKKSEANSNKQALVVLNTNNDQLEIVSGIFAVKVRNKDVLKNLLGSYPIEVSYSAEHLDTYHLRVKNVGKIFEISNKIKLIDGVSNVEVDIIHGKIEAL